MTLLDVRPHKDIPRLSAALKDRDVYVHYHGGWRHLLKDGRLIDVEVVSQILELDGGTWA